MASRKKKLPIRRYYETQKKRGFYCMHRGWQYHPMFRNEPYTEREAWEWMISEATFSHDGRLKNICGHEVFLMREQLSFSVRFMADAWGWDKSKAHRFIQKLERSGMIRTETGTGEMIITICNYDQYQLDYEASETGGGTPPRQRKDTGGTNNKKDKTVKKEKEAGSSAARAGSHASLPAVEEPKEEWKATLKEELGEAVYRSWIEPLRLHDGYVFAPTRFMWDWCKNHYEDKIREAVDDYKGLKFQEDKEAA